MVTSIRSSRSSIKPTLRVSASRSLSLAFCLALLATTLCFASAGDAKGASYRVLIPATGAATRGSVAFVDTLNSQIVEIDKSGRVLWRCRLPVSGSFNSGADLEWVRSDDSFLLVAPLSGIYRIGRACDVRWQYGTAKVSHDADFLPNGNVLFAYGWDSESDPQAVEVNPQGQVVWQWFASGRIDPSWRRPPQQREGRSSWSHANAVVRLPDGDTLVSLRNMHRVVRVRPNGDVASVYGPIRAVHEPTLRSDGTLIAAQRGPDMVVAWKDGKGRPVYRNELGLTPIRTVEVLPSGNMLLTGGDSIAEISADGKTLWHVEIYPRGSLRNSRAGLYKATYVDRR
jgi:hypothetical protein